MRSMDFREGSGEDFKGLWTNERHVSYINQMESSFVRRMLENGGLFMRAHASTALHVPLDRYIPDRSESTQSSQQWKKRRFTNPPDIRNLSWTKKRKTRKQYSSLQLDSSQDDDQVVPQIGLSKSDKEDDSYKQKVAVVEPNKN